MQQFVNYFISFISELNTIECYKQTFIQCFIFLKLKIENSKSSLKKEEPLCNFDLSPISMTGHKVDTYIWRECTHIGAWFYNLAPISRGSSRICILKVPP